MKICTKCQKEYPDDMAFCSYCGTTLQPKIEERVCPACGKTVHADNLRFCPYCAYNFTTLQEKTSPNPKVPLPPAVNIKKNYVKMQPLNHEEKPVPKNLTSDVPRNVCPSCNSVIYAQNLKSCPYCGEKIDFSKTPPPVINSKPTLHQPAQGNVCPACGKVIHAKNINSCPYCGKSLTTGISNTNNQPPSNTIKPLPTDVNIKKNYVKMQPLNQDSKTDTNETINNPINNTSTNKSNSENTDGESNSQGSFLTFLVCCVIALVINGFIFSFLINAICSCAVLFSGWNLIKGYYRTNRILPLIATILIIIITIGGLGVLKSIGKETIRRRAIKQPPVLIVNDIALLK